MIDIGKWLADLGLPQYEPAFRDNDIDAGLLAELTSEDLKDIGVTSVGHRRKMLGAMALLHQPTEPVQTDPDLPTSNPHYSDRGETSEAERRHLTVMFVDLVGSTDMATRLDAEDMRDVITSYQNTVAGVVSRYEGFVAKFMGDGVLCYFGWPRANEDDAERAVRAGLSIIEAVKKTKAANGSLLSTRVGIATGVVIVGDLIGSGATQEAAVVGETPNLAARLQGVAGLNQLVVAKETQRLLGAIFDLSPLVGQNLKGIAGSVDAYLVEGDASVQSRFAARQSGAMTPIVGREREIDLMTERWALARSGQGQMVIVSGEAGIGKSRITQAVIEEVAKDDHTRMTYQCSPYYADSAFYPVTQQMSFAAGFAQSDSPDIRLDKLEKLLGSDQDTLRLVAPLLGLDGEARYGALDLTPAQQRAHTMKALAGLLANQAAEKPVLMVFEDLHWIDPTSQELLDILLDQITDQRIMILATARPTFEYGFGGHPIVTRFALNRLGKDQIGAIVSKLTGGKALPDEIMEIIAQRTDGVPLFVEELTKTILESGALKEGGERYILDGPLSAIAIPTTLHDSLMARLDRLNPIKEVAQTAACIGREFSHGLLSQISPLPDAELSEAMEGLIAAELIYRRGLPPEATYLFKHALVRDAAYESLLKERRRALHTRILVALEADRDIAPEVLAVHAEAANHTDRAIDLWEAASTAALGRPAFDEAISHLKHAIRLITPQLENSDSGMLTRALSLEVQLGATFMARSGWGADETKAAFEQALVLADRIGETPLRFSILYGLMTTRYLRADHVEAVRHGEAFVRLTDAASDTASAATANRSYGVALTNVGRLAEAQHHYDRALALFDADRHKGLEKQYGIDMGVGVNGFLSINLALLGDSKRARKHFRDVEHYGMNSGHVGSVCYQHTVGALNSLLWQDELEFKRHSNNLAFLATEHSLVWFQQFSSLTQSLLLAGKGDHAGIANYIKADAAIVATKSKMIVPICRVEAARRSLALGSREQASELAEMAQELIDKTGETYALSDLHRLQAAIANAGNDTEAAERHLGTSLDIARQQGAKLWELRAAIDLANLWRDQGKTAEAVALLQPVHDSIAEGDCPEDRTKAQALLTDMAE